MHESRAIADVLRAAEEAAAGRPLRHLHLRVEGDDHLDVATVRMHLSALTETTHPELQVTVDVDRTIAPGGLRLVSIGTG